MDEPVDLCLLGRALSLGHQIVGVAGGVMRFAFRLR
jgi:hypothetical protein